MQYDIFSAFDGKYGKVVTGESYDEDEDVVKFEGKNYDFGEELGFIEEWVNEHNVDLNQGTYFQSHAYRGTGCYEAIIPHNGNLYSLDIVSEGTVCQLVEIKG